MEPGSQNVVDGQAGPAVGRVELRFRLFIERNRWLASMSSHVPHEVFFRYLLVGLWNTLFGYATFSLFTWLFQPLGQHSYLLAMLISSPLNITVAFLGYKHFVFRTKGHYLREWLGCLAVNYSGMAIGLITMPILVTALRRIAGLQVSAPYIAAAALTVFGVVYNFLGYRNVSFRATRDAQS